MSTAHLDTLGIFFIVGWLIGSDAAKAFYWLRRARRAERRLQEWDDRWSQ